MPPQKPLGPVDAVLFDHDGTLVDSIPVVLAASNGVLAELGLPAASDELVVAGMIHSTEVRLGMLAGIDDRNRRLDLARRYNRLAMDRLGQARLYPGVAALLASLAARGRFLGVVSNSEGAFIRTALAGLGVAGQFRVFVGADDMPAPKPDPRGLLAALGGIAPGRAVYVGDSSTDLATARAAGMRAVAVTWGTHSRAELAELDFDALADTPQDLANLL